MSNLLAKNPAVVHIISPEIPYSPAVASVPAYDTTEIVWVTTYVLVVITPAYIDRLGHYHPAIYGYVAMGTHPVTEIVHHPAVPGRPEQPYVPAVVETISDMGWNAGARSIDSITGTGQYKFSIPADVVGVVTGLNNANPDAGFANIDFAFEFTANQFRVMENGSVGRTLFAPYSPSDVFSVLRDGVTMKYYQNSTQVYVAGLRTVETLFADASLYQSSDSIVDASISSSIALPGGDTTTGDVVESGAFSERDLLAEALTDRGTFAVALFDFADAPIGTTGGVVDGRDLEAGVFSEAVLDDVDIVVSGTFSQAFTFEFTANPGIPGHPPGEFPDSNSSLLRGTFHEAFALDESCFEVGSITSDTFDIDDPAVGITPPGTVTDKDEIEAGLLHETFLSEDLLVESGTFAISGDGDTPEVSGADEITELLVESGALSEAVLQNIFGPDLVESGTFTATAAIGGTFASDVVEDGVLHTAEVFSTTSTTTAATGTFSLANTFRTDSAGNDGAIEHGSFSNAMTLGGVLAQSFTQSGVMSEAVSAGVTDLVVEHGTFSLANAITGTFTNLTGETGTFSSASASINNAVSAVNETGTFSEATAQAMTATQNVIDYGFFSDESLGGGAGGAWHAHLETFAMSRYTNYGYQSMAEVDGVLIGVNGDGVFRLDGDDDAGADIDATVEHDWLDDKNPQLKRPRSLYVNGSTPRGLYVYIGHSDNDGEEGTSGPYEVPPGKGGLRNARANLGRGIRSRYLKPTISNFDGGDFSLASAALMVDAMKRML